MNVVPEELFGDYGPKDGEFQLCLPSLFSSQRVLFSMALEFLVFPY